MYSTQVCQCTITFIDNYVLNSFRDAGDGFHTVRYDMSIDTDFMKSLRIGLPYKYVVYSPLMKVTKHQYEYLHGAPYQGANTSRLLKVPKEELFPGSKQYFFYIYCAITCNTLVNAIWGIHAPNPRGQHASIFIMFHE